MFSDKTMAKIKAKKLFTPPDPERTGVLLALAGHG
jgi:hypothetical protein